MKMRFPGLCSYVAVNKYMLILMILFYVIVDFARQSIRKMSTELLNAVPNVEIDPEGTFKYVLIRVYAPQTPDGGEPSKVVVRGNRRGAYHG